MKSIDQIIDQFNIAKQALEIASSINLDGDVMDPEIQHASQAKTFAANALNQANNIIDEANRNRDEDLPLMRIIASSIDLAADTTLQIETTLITIQSYDTSSRSQSMDVRFLAGRVLEDIAAAREAIQTTRNEMAAVETTINSRQASVNATAASSASTTSDASLSKKPRPGA